MLKYDIAIAHLSRSFPNISKPKLASRIRHTEGKSQSFGYGAKRSPIFEHLTLIRPPRSDKKLRKLNSKTIKTDRCNRLIKKTKLVINGFELTHEPVTDHHICIEVTEDDNLCHGDSGGPTFINGRLSGVTSRGTPATGENGTLRACNGAGPTILMNVRTFRSWIRSVM